MKKVMAAVGVAALLVSGSAFAGKRAPSTVTIQSLSKTAKTAMGSLSAARRGKGTEFIGCQEMYVEAGTSKVVMVRCTANDGKGKSVQCTSNDRDFVQMARGITKMSTIFFRADKGKCTQLWVNRGSHTY